MKIDEGFDAHEVGLDENCPEYKISFWTYANGAWSESWVGITEADADEVLAWAASTANGRHYIVWARYVSTGSDGSPQLVDLRLLGTEPGWTGDEDRYPQWARRPDQGPP